MNAVPAPLGGAGKSMSSYTHLMAPSESEVIAITVIVPLSGAGLSPMAWDVTAAPPNTAVVASVQAPTAVSFCRALIVLCPSVGRHLVRR